MGTIQSGVGLASGVNITQIVTALINAQKGAVTKLEARVKDYQATQTGYSTVITNLLSISTSASQLKSVNNFDKRSATVADASQLSATANKDAVPGSYQFRVVAKATAQQIQSQGFADATQTVGTGTINITRGGKVSSRTQLDLLNGGTGVTRGQIRITDRSGASGVVDISDAITVDDALKAINSQTQVRVAAHVEGDKIVLEDQTGSTTSNLIVSEVNGGTTATSLGLLGSVASTKLSGSDVFAASGSFKLSQLNDGNGVKIETGADAIRIHLTDVSGSTVSVNLDGAITLNDVVSKINADSESTGKVQASISGGRLVITDLTGGGGAGALTVEDLNGSSVVHQLGLDAAASGATLTSNRLVAGIDSVLLRNLRGGQGITQRGQIQVTDRTGTTATLNLSTAESLNDVLTAINNATSAGSVKLKLSASINAAGNGIVVTDSSGSTTSNFVIADVGGSTLASELGIAVNAAQTKVSSGTLSQRFISDSTDLSKFTTNGTLDRRGFILTSSTGIGYLITLPSTITTVGDVIDRLNNATGGLVKAQLNSTGDGFELVDYAGGTNALRVDELGGTSAADLRLSGAGTLGGDGKYHLTARAVTKVSVTSTDTVSDIANKLDKAGGLVRASLLNTGSAVNPQHIQLRSTTAGYDGELVIDDGSLGLGLSTNIQASDSVLRVGGEGSQGYLLSSSKTRFFNAVPGVTIDVLKASTSPTEVTVSADNSVATSSLQDFVDHYNTLLDSIATLTKFDSTTGDKGILQGDAQALRVQDRLSRLISTQYADSSKSIRNLADLGIKVSDTGKLSLDTDRLDQAFAEHPDEVTSLFTTASKGFGVLLDSTVKSFTDSIDGTLVKANELLQNNIDTINNRVEELNAILEIKRTTLTQKYIKMDQIVGSLQSQSSAISAMFGTTSSSSTSSSK